MHKISLSQMAKHLLMINDYLPCCIPQGYDINDINVKMFKQIWGNTAGGMCTPGMIAGQAFVTQMTYVVYNSNFNLYHVFFNGQFAYKISGDKSTQQFINDMQNEQLKSKGYYKEFYVKEEEI